MRQRGPDDSRWEEDRWQAQEDRWSRDAERGLGEFAEGTDFAAKEKKKVVEE